MKQTLPALKLYQYDICPFCCKLKAFLDWQKIPYSAVDVNPLTKSEISFSKEYRKVPIVVMDGEQVNDSSVIISKLVENLNNTGGKRVAVSEDTQKWLEFTDKKLAVLLFPNITRNMFESWEAFGYINKVPHFGFVQKLVLRISGSVAMRLANGKIKKKYSIEDERAALRAAISEWVSEGLSGRKFHGGEVPDLADVAVFGCLKSIEEFTAFGWLLEVSSRDFLIWFNRMDEALGESSCVSRE